MSNNNQVIVAPQNTTPVTLLTKVKGRKTDYPYISGKTETGEDVRLPVFQIPNGEWRLTFSLDIHSHHRPYKPNTQLKASERLLLYPDNWDAKLIRSFLRQKFFKGTIEKVTIPLATGQVFELQNLVTAAPIEREV